jgi:two-component system alkaline phosphatase synthesis response regulator PhoP
MGEKSSRILVVDDDVDILALLKYNFEKEGFQVKTVDNSRNTLKAAYKFQPDLVILDVLMPHLNGFEVCEKLRNTEAFENIYIFFLTARPENTFQEAALRIGGDDYIEKLTGIRALLYKVNSVLKKKYIIQKRIQQLKIGDLLVDRQTNSVFFKDQQIAVNESEFEILFFMIQNRDRKMSLDNLIYNVWGSEVHPFQNTVKLYIENLQRKIMPDVIKVTSHGEYRFGW